MNEQEWLQREQYYMAKVNAINIPADINPLLVISLQAQIDAIYSEARFDYAKSKRVNEDMKRKYKAAQAEAGMALKKLTADAAIPKENKPTNDRERDAWATNYLMTTNLPGMSMTIFKAMEIAEKRYIFMEAVIDILKEKAGRLITDVGCLKLDAFLTADKLGKGASNLMANDPNTPTLAEIQLPDVVPAPVLPAPPEV